MSTVAAALTSWEEFAALPDPENGAHLELRDGEVVCVPPPRAIHTYVQGVLSEWLTAKAQGRGRASNEFPYRPAANLQFWVVDVDARTIEVSMADLGSRLYGIDDQVPVSVLPGVAFPVRLLFED